MAFVLPIWMQNPDYPARVDRLALLQLFGHREQVVEGLVVSQNGGGNLSVNVSVGACTVQGDNQANQGLYLLVLDAIYNLVMPAAPGSNKRIDLICAQVRDPQAGGAAGDDWLFTVTQGVVAASPAPPATPTSALAIARVTRTAGDAAVLNAHILDVAPRGAWPYTISSANVPVSLPPNHLYIKV